MLWYRERRQESEKIILYISFSMRCEWLKAKSISTTVKADNNWAIFKIWNTFRKQIIQWKETRIVRFDMASCIQVAYMGFPRQAIKGWVLILLVPKQYYLRTHEPKRYWIKSQSIRSLDTLLNKMFTKQYKNITKTQVKTLWSSTMAYFKHLKISHPGGFHLTFRMLLVTSVKWRL